MRVVLGTIRVTCDRTTHAARDHTSHVVPNHTWSVDYDNNMHVVRETLTNAVYGQR